MAAIAPSPTRTIYRYHQADGTEYCQVVRIDYDDGRKEFRVLPSGLEGPHPLYRAERLAVLSAETTVFVVEGEKCVHAVEAAGLPAVTSKGGSGSPQKTDWAPLAAFRHIVVLPDNDEPGRKYARAVVDILQALPGKRDIVLCDLPSLPEKDDVYDYLLDHTAAELLAVIAEYGQPVDRACCVAAQDWPEPKPVSSVSSVVPGVLEKMLPPALGPWCFDAAHRMQAPVDYIAVAAITSLGSLIGRQLSIRPKARDSWAVVPNIWAALVGQPSMMKSPCLKEARRFLDAIDREAQAEYEHACGIHEKAVMLFEISEKAARTKALKAKTSDDREKALAEIGDPPPVPTRPRTYTQDATVEKIQDILKDNPRGMLVLRDELVGFLRGLDKPGQEGSRAFFLEAWEGNGRFLVDRIGRGSTAIDGVCLGVLGGATPGGLSEYVSDALGNGTGADGLLQRFSLIAFPDPMEDFVYVDRAPDDLAAADAQEAFTRCVSIDPQHMGAECYGDSLPFLRFDQETQVLFMDWYSELMGRCRRDDEHPAIQSHLMKFTKMVPAIALVFHVADGGHGPVHQACFLQATAWAEYAEAHARRLYEGVFHDVTVNAAVTLLRHIQVGDLQSGFSIRDVSRKCWTGLVEQGGIQNALTELEDAGYLRRKYERPDGGGRATIRYEIHPNYGGNTAHG